MATDGNLRVSISADVKDLKKGLIQADKGVKAFGKSTQQLSNQTKQMGKVVKTNALPAVTSFSQVVQDAPYGIRGVANNIQQLTMQMGHLSANAGGAGKAMKAMVSSLVGPAGILLAVSLITSALVSYGDELKGLVGRQNDLSDAFEDSSEDIGVQISKLNKLSTAIDDSTLSESERKKLYDKVKREYPSFLGQLDLDKAARDKITEAINNERKAIIGLGITKALEAKKAPLYAQIAEAELKSTQELLTATDKQFIYGIADPDTRMKFRKELAAKNKKATIEDAENTLKEIQGTIKDIVKKYGVPISQILNLGDGSGITKSIDKTKNAVIKPLEAFGKEYVELTQDVTKGISQGLAAIIPKQADTYSDAFANQLLALQNFNKQADNIIKGGIAETFANLGTVIGDALYDGTNVLEGAGVVLLAGLGNVLTQLGQMAIAVGVGLLGIKKALSTLNPAVAIAAGVGLVALGSVFSKGAQSLSESFGGGGSVSSGVGGSGGGGFSGSNFGSSSTRSVTGGHYVFEIQGTKLVGVLRNTLSRNNSLGGGISLTG